MRVKVDLLSRLTAIEGLEVAANEPLAPHTTFRIGGPAEFLVRVGSEPALQNLVSTANEYLQPYQVLGLGSNVLIPDRGVGGVVILLEGEFLEFVVVDELVDAGAGMPLARLARQALELGLVGLEALAGFPSTVGGAVYMNAGSHGVEITDVVETVVAVMPDGRRVELSPSELEPDYRRTNLQGSGAIVTRARLRLQRADPGPARQRMESINRRRRETLPSGKPNVGSVFRNPGNDHAGRLIEACGLKGRCSGGAEISVRHANVIVNNGGATADDVFELMRLSRQSVAERFGVDLEPEVVLVGELAERWLEFGA